MNRSIFKAYDIRGMYPSEINELSIATVGKACAHEFADGEIILAHDIRHGSEELVKALAANLAEEGKKIDKRFTLVNIGLTTTPMFNFIVNQRKASGGCIVTASHNPKNYNGVKIVKEGAESISGTHILHTIDSLSL